MHLCCSFSTIHWVGMLEEVWKVSLLVKSQLLRWRILAKYVLPAILADRGTSRAELCQSQTQRGKYKGLAETWLGSLTICLTTVGFSAGRGDILQGMTESF